MYSQAAYRSLLRLTLDEGYQFINFFDERPAEGKFIYLRHDIDWSLKLALQVAEVNHSLGISATFFMLLRGHNYNFFDQRELEDVRAIHALGQHIGFHYALPPVIPADDAAFINLIKQDFEVFAREFPQADPIFAWHNTTPQVIEWGLTHEIPGLLNVYNKALFKDIAYYSDSLARHTVPELEAIIRRGHPVIQLLFHPGIWNGGANLKEISVKLWRAIIRHNDADPTGQDQSVAHHLPYWIPDALLDALDNAILRWEDKHP